MKKLSLKALSLVLALTMIVPMFVLPGAAEDTAPQTITSTEGYSNIEVRVTTDKDPLNYSIGDTVTFTMKVYADNKHVSVPQIKYTLEGDGDATHAKLQKSGTLYPDANGVFTLTEDVISIPGYMRLEGDIYSADGSTKWAETPDNDRAKVLGAGILVDYKNITTVMPEPEDFDAVWADRLADLDAVAPKIVRIDKVTKWYSGSTLKTSISGSDVYAVYIDCIGSSGDVLTTDDIGNQAGATWAVAYLTVPKNKADGSMSISQGYQGYGINTATPVETSSGIAVNMATHSLVLLNNENAAPSGTYKSKYASYIKNGAKYGYDSADNSAIETCYFANLLLRDIQALRFARQAFGAEGAASLVTDDTVINGMTKSELLTAIDYWKGLHNGKLSTSGGSQGGFQAIGVGALVPDVASVNANIPWMGDTHTNTDTNKVQGSSRPTVGEGIRYCDTAFLVARVKAPVTITAKLVDKSCVPTGVIAIWNNLVESKKDVDGYMGSITWAQSGTHGYTPSYPENPTQILRTYELNEPTGIANNQGGFVKSGYTDIDGYTVDQDAQPPVTGYVQIGTKTQTLATVTNSQTPSFYFVEGGDAYYNAELKKLVFISSGTLKGHYQKNTSSAYQNVNTNGVTWYVEFWAAQNKLNIKEVEFRYGTGGGSFSGIGYVTTLLTATETVKYDTKLSGCSWGGQKDAGLVVGMTSLRSLGHGSFSTDGEFTATTYKAGTVDLTGFTGISTSNWKYMLYKCASVEKVVTNTLEGANMFEGCSMLTSVTVPSTATLTSIGANNFNNCEKLEEINVECTLSSLTIGSAAFSGLSIIINVKTDADKTIVTNALSAASITNITVLSAGEEPPVVEEPEFDEGIAYGEDGYTNSKYSDIDSATSGYVQIGTNDKTKATVTDTFTPKLYYIKNGSTTNGGAYYNPKLNKIVLTIDWGSLTGGSTDVKVDSTHNQDTVGATWYLAYWVKQNSTSIKEVEFRVINGTKLAYIGQFMSVLTSAVSVKFDSRITISNDSAAESSGIFTKMTSLKSVGHGTFAANGDFTPTTYEEGTVNVLGFSETTAGNFAYSFNGTTSVKSAKTHTLAASNMFNGCTNLASVTVPEGATVASIGASVFNNCSTLEDITILGTVDSEITINSTAFAGTTQDIAVTVNTEAEKGYFEAALDDSITNVTVVAASEEPEPDVPDEPDEPDDPDTPTVPEGTITPIDVSNVITADGFQIRTKSYNGLRALFTFDQNVADQVSGYTLVSYGAIASSYDRFINTYDGDEDALFEAARSNPGGAVKYIAVYNEDGTGLNRYTDIAKKQFCISLININPENALSDIYVAGYAIWKDASGNLGYTLTTYDMADGEKAVNLYEITLGLTKTGLINSEITDDICFWQVLKNGALKTNSFNTANDAYTSPAYSLTDGYFTYCDVDWYAYVGNSTTSWWGSTKPTGVSSSASGLVWSVLKYSDSEYVMIYRNKNKTTNQNLQIPMHSVNAKAYAPYDYRYGADVGVKLATYNPALTQADFNKILTVVIDHGVSGMNHGGLSAIDKATTIVYPSSFSAKNQAFTNTKNLKNVIWCHTDESGNPVKHMSEFDGITSLVDLRGFTAIGFTETFSADWPIENIVFGATTSGSASKTFSGLTQLKRVWSAGQSMPDAGTLDLSALNITSIGQQTFDNAKMATTIKLCSTITKISGNKALGNGLSIDFICDDSVAALIVAYAKGDYATQTTKISVNGKETSTLIS